jgi:hypothetical protein
MLFYNDADDDDATGSHVAFKEGFNPFRGMRSIKIQL